MRSQSYFRSAGYLKDAVISTESGSDIDLIKLPPFLRTLLVTDGTVTKSLEAWFWEKVSIDPISNHKLMVDADFIENTPSIKSDLEVDIGDGILQREVVLKGNASNTIFASARSTVSLNSLPADIGLALEKGEIGIGELLREKGVETYRDIFNINYFSVSVESDSLITLFKSDVLSRSYRIRINDRPAIVVTEFFPINKYL